MSSITAGTYPESVSSCHPPTPPPSPPPHPAPASAIHGDPLSRRLDFANASTGGDLWNDDDDDDDDFLIRAVEYIERAPRCVCGRGNCVVERDEQRGRWVYVCPSQPRCNYVSMCEEVGLDPEIQPTVRSPPKQSNNCMINISSNHAAEPRTTINDVNLRGADATAPNIVSPQATITPLKSTSQSVGTTIPLPLHVSPKGPNATAAVKVSPQGTRCKDKKPICKCTAGKCRVLTVGREDYYVCPIPKGQGACNYMVPVVAAVNEPAQTGTRGDKHLKDSLVEKEDNGNNLVEAQDNNKNGSVSLVKKEDIGNNLVEAQGNNENGSVNPPQLVEKEAHENNLLQTGDDISNGSVNSPQSDDECPFDVINNEIVPTAQTMPCAEVRQASPSMKCETTAMAEAPTKLPVPPYGSISPINTCSENRVSTTGRILEACGELMISCCSGLAP